MLKYVIYVLMDWPPIQLFKIKAMKNYFLKFIRSQKSSKKRTKKDESIKNEKLKKFP